MAVFEGHDGAVMCCAWSPDDARIASACEWESTVRVWDADTGQEVIKLEGPDIYDVAVRWCAWSPDGARLAAASYDNTVRVWDVHTWGEVATLEGHTAGAYTRPLVGWSEHFFEGHVGWFQWI